MDVFCVTQEFDNCAPVQEWIEQYAYTWYFKSNTKAKAKAFEIAHKLSKESYASRVKAIEREKKGIEDRTKWLVDNKDHVSYDYIKKKFEKRVKNLNGFIYKTTCNTDDVIEEPNDTGCYRLHYTSITVKKVTVDMDEP